MGRHGWRKRSRREYETDNRLNVGQTLSHMQQPGGDASTFHVNGHEEEQNGGEWQQVKRRKKSSDKDGGNYPSISHSSHSRLQGMVKLSDVQNLILYLLADGTSPQWCAVQHDTNVRKVVALMVPGLEPGMFNGTIPLDELQELPDEDQDDQATSAADSSELIEQNDAASKNQPPTSLQTKRTRTIFTSPDDYYPRKMSSFQQLPSALQPLCEIFPNLWPIKTPGDDKFARMHSPLASMLVSPVVKTKEEKRGKGPKPPPESKNWKNQRTPITEFIATTEELSEEGYVLHPAHYSAIDAALIEVAKRELDKTTVADGWVDTPNIPTLASGDVPDMEIESKSILGGRRILALDCEMCITSPKGVSPQVFSLTRISLVDWNGEVVMDEFVKPDQPITDYLTPYSGITPAMLENVATSLGDVQQKLVNDILTPQTILIGHSLDSDFKALKLTHPFVIDTALIFPHPRGPPLKSSLKWLAQKYLSREIQKGHGVTGHDSIEDARACLDLVKQKCERGKAWGTSEASSESIFKRLGRALRPKRYKANPIGDDELRTGAVVDWGEPSRGYGAAAKLTIGCENDEQVVQGIKRAIYGSENDTTNPNNGVDFIFGRLRELEAYRGWWNRSKTADNDDLRNGATSASASSSLATVTKQTVDKIVEVWNALPPCTGFVVFSGSGDPRELAEMQDLQRTFKDEYKVKKWDELSVQWTDVEEQKLRAACVHARLGVGFMAVK